VKPSHTDGRLPVARLYDALAGLERGGWEKRLIAEQRADDGESFPVFAYFNGRPAERVIIGGIHGREPAGSNAIAAFADRLVALGREVPILVLPLLNPWGYLHDSRYGPSGKSVTDADYFLGRADGPSCPEAASILSWILGRASIAPGAAAIDLHEDPVFEEPGYVFEGRGSYLYATGAAAATHPVTERVAGYLHTCSQPLAMTGTTRFGEALVRGMIVDSEDGSVDELLAKKKGCSPVLTTELVLRSRTDPPLPERVAAYVGTLEAFFAG